MARTPFDGQGEGDGTFPAPLQRDSTMLEDMLAPSTIRALTTAFAETSNIAIGVFTPDGRRLGWEPVHQCGYCKHIYTSPAGREACDQCDRANMPQGQQIVEPYRCHANLLEFSVPILAQRKDGPVLIGAMFAGQLRPTEHISEGDVERLRAVAGKYGLGFDTLLALYDERPWFPEERVQRIQGFMKALADAIGQMVTRRYEQHSLMQQLSRMGKPEDVTIAIAKYMDADACSMFTQNVGERGRIYLRATSFEPLQAEIGEAFYEGGEGLTGWVYQNNRTLNLTNVGDPEALRKIDPKLTWANKVVDVPRTQHICSSIAVPIRDDYRRCVGVIRAVRVDGEFFSPLQQETFEAIADMARQIVELAKSQEERQMILSVAEGVLAGNPLEKVIESSMKQAMRLFEHCADNIWLTRYLPAEGQFEIVASYPADALEVGKRFSQHQAIAGWSLEHHGQMLFSNDLRKQGIESFVESVKACIEYPIMFGDEFFGTFTVASSRTGVFTESDARQLQLLGAQVTQAFENARHFEHTRKEQDTLRKYFQCLDRIANLDPPWEPRSVTERVCAELQRLGFATISEELYDSSKKETSRRGWEKVPGTESYREWNRSGFSDDECFSLRLCDAACGGTVTATAYLSPREGEMVFAGIDRLCLALAERLAAGRLRGEAEVASTVTASIGASSHGLRAPITTVRDRIDSLLHEPGASLPDSLRTPLEKCQEKLNSVLEWCETSELLTQYRRGCCPTEADFLVVNVWEYLARLLEACQELPGWDFEKGDVPPETLVRAHLPGLRRILGELIRNAEEHGIRKGARKVTLALFSQAAGHRVQIAVSNVTDNLTPERAADLQEKARAPERMAFSRWVGIGTQLAAVIAKMHGGSLQVTVQANVVTFSFTLPVCAPPAPSVS